MLALVIGVGLYQTLGRSAEPAADAGPAAAGVMDERVVREDSRRLSTAADGKVTFVEFLDFECESCRAAYPAVEQLRQTYDGRVTFVARYFPLDGHVNGRRAARAVEAAARQGQFEAMYQRMYETQTQWGEQQVPKDDVFREFPVDLGLHMEQWEADDASAEVEQRIQADVEDGTALGVTGTPTFFLNGKPFAPESYEDLTRAFDEALAS
ncbi:MAG: Periplasmic thiol:disulfide interchange protein DsbA [uncultured Friedmanniella sp.]|uniref:Periplasmic thiol:disulfide interchange protein DsbA n=1 Tax=uncultured Friedmanniella sp. TaxID=335381 RepID=A0A6J4LLX5_9ACTN|nr:MAG: Periplasmic thiol:disulfide interchange protein DsbA [uncultured Friedmanniella sp.]